MIASPKLIRVLRRLLLSVALLATAVAVVVTEENWRGDRAWQRCEADLIARGYDIAEARPVPRERDLFASETFKAIVSRSVSASDESPVFDSPVVQRIYEAVRYTFTLHPWDAAKARQILIDEHLIRSATTANAAEDIRAALKPADAFLDAVCVAVESHPNATWPSDDPLMAQFSFPRFRGLIQLLCFRAKAELAVGDRDAAFRDVSTVVSLGERLVEARSFLVNVMIAMVAYQTAFDIVESGYASHCWTDEQLLSLQERIGRLRPLARIQEPSPTGERLAFLRALDRPAPALWGLHYPWWLFHGWLQQNKVASSRFNDAVEAVIDRKTDTVSAQGLAALKNIERKAHTSWSPYTYLLRSSNFSEVLPKVANARDKLVAKTLGIAAERFYLAYHRYPNDADEFVPRFRSELPRGAISGQPATVAGNRSSYVVKVGEANYAWPSTAEK